MENREIKIRRRRLWDYVTEEGDALDAVLVIVNKPWLMRYVTLDDAEAEAKGYRTESRVIQYRRGLYLDLWFFDLKCLWLSPPTVQ